MAKLTKNFTSGWAQLILEVTRDSTSAENGTSKLKCVLQIKKLQKCPSKSNGNANIKVTIGGTSVYTSDSFDISNLAVGSTKTLATKYHVVTHDVTGAEKSVKCVANFISSRELGDAKIEQTFTCAAIDRKSTLTVSGNTIGSNVTLSVSKKISTSKYKLKVYTSTDSGTNKTYKSRDNFSDQYMNVDKQSWLPDINTYASLNTSGTVIYFKFEISTYTNDNKHVGTSSVTDVKFTIPEDGAKPYNITCTVGDLTVYQGHYGFYIQNKSHLIVSNFSAKGRYGATIKQYKVSINNEQLSGNTEFKKIPTAAGDNEIKITAIDSRGYSATITKKVNVVSYYDVAITSYKTQRFNKYVRIDYAVKFASLNNANRFHLELRNSNGSIIYKSDDFAKSSGQWIINLDEGKEYNNVYLYVQDHFTNAKTGIFNIPGLHRIINVTKDGTGVAFGRQAHPQAYDFSSKVRCYDGDFVVKNNKHGYYVTNADGNPEPGLFKNESNLWIGADYTNNGQHITGSTHISAGTNPDGIYACKRKDDGTYQSYLVLDSNNYSRYTSTSLCNLTTGTYGTVALNSDVSNFKFVEIFYTENNGVDAKSTRVYAPSGKQVELACVSSSTSTGVAYIKTTRWLLSGKSLTFQHGRKVTLTHDTKVTVENLTTNDKIKIFGVFGYK